RAESACSNDGTGSTAAAIGERKGWNGGSDSGWSQTRSSIWEEFWQAGGTDKAVRRLRGKKLPSGYVKSPGSTNAHSGKAPDLSGPTLAPLETSFLRRQVANFFRRLCAEKMALRAVAHGRRARYLRPCSATNSAATTQICSMAATAVSIALF